MAGFRMHVTTSTVLGCGYAGAGHLLLGLPLETSILGGALCGFSGMLPDLDSDYGVPLRESMAFTAAIVPMLLVGRFQSLALSYDAMVLAAVSMYLFIRFGVTKLIRRYTVHRGMFHSIPACLIFAGMAFLICGASNFQIRCYKSGGVVAGFMSHLILDEIYAIEWKRGRWHFKKSFGTALKFWGNDAWANFSTYAKLVIVATLVLGEPSVMKQIEARNPQLARRLQELQHQLGEATSLPAAAQSTWDAAGTAAAQYFQGNPPPVNEPPPLPTQNAFPQSSNPPPTIRSGYNTAQRPGSPYE